MAHNHWLEQSLTTIHAALREGRLRARDLAEAAISVRETNPAAGSAYRQAEPQLTRQASDFTDAILAKGDDPGPLAGLPLSIKDMYGVPGYTTWAGSPRALPAQWEQPGPVVEAALHQGAVVTGKTHTVEFAFGGLGVNEHHGTPINPHDSTDHRVPGGSSSGAGVSVATGSALLALGTDTAGSVRVPASMTGVAGLKTTRGRWSTRGLVPLSSTLDSLGLMARRVEDLIFAFKALDPALTGGLHADTAPFGPATALRLGVPADFFCNDCSPGVNEAFEGSLQRFAAAGIELVRVELPGTEEAWELFRTGGLAAPELVGFLQRELPEWLDTLDTRVALRIRGVDTLTATEYLQRCALQQRLAAAANKRFYGTGAVDALLTPTVPLTPPRLTDVTSEADYARCNLLALRNTVMVNLMDLCAVTLPAGKDMTGMPVGLQVIAGTGADAKALHIGGMLERVLGG